MTSDYEYKVLLAGESWVTSATHYKGWDQFGSVTYELGAEHFAEALAGSQFHLTYMPAHIAARDFPQQLDELQEYGAVILSDIGSNTLLLHPDTWRQGKPTPNRLKLIREYVREGDGFLMVGGYYSFQGINGAARYRKTPIEEILPVNILPYDDRVEVPEGFLPRIVGSEDHPILAGLGKEWPMLLGYNELELKPDTSVEVLAQTPEEVGGHPLLVCGEYGKGRTVAWASDIGPHWLPEDFAKWDRYGELWRQVLKWLVQ